MIQYSPRLKNIFCYLLSVIALLWPALYNAFPLVNPDTGAYINSGFRFSLHPDRPFGYGLFILVASAKVSLWLVVIVQASILGWLIRRLCSRLLGAQATNVVTVAVTWLIGIGTTVSWYAGQITPDIFTAALLLCLLLFFLEYKNRKKARTYGIVIFLLCATHNSNVLILLGLSVLLMLYFRRKSLRDYFAPARSVFLIALSYFIVQSTAYLIGGYGFRFSPATHVFLMSRMAENGILDQYLKDECPVQHYSLCDFEGKLGMRQWDFMWGPDYPHNKLGWMQTRKEYNRIIMGTLTTPKLLALHVLRSAEGTLRQIPLIQLSDALNAEAEGSNTQVNIAAFYYNELKEYGTSLQAENGLRGAAENNNILILLFAVSTGLAALWLSRGEAVWANAEQKPDWALLFGIVILFLVLNAWLTSTFSTVVARFQARVFWVLPLLCVLYILNSFFARQNAKQQVE